MNKIRLIGVDLDGTLLNDNKIITAYTKKVLQKIIKMDTVVVPTTGRPKEGLAKELLSIPGIKYAITSNGAQVIDIQKDKVLFSRSLSKEKALRIIDLVSAYPVTLDAAIDGKLFMEEATIENLYDYLGSKHGLLPRYPVENIRDFIIKSNYPLEKVNVIFKNQDLKSTLYNKIKALGNLSITSSHRKNLEVNSYSATKGKGLLLLADFLNIKKEEIMAIGDSSNDVDMLSSVGLPIAMGNGSEEVKNLSSFITLTNNEDGAARAIERFAL